MNVDPIKISNKLAELNADPQNVQWIAGDDYYAVTKLTFKDEGEAVFHGTSGMPLKAFVNTVTGEVRFFHINTFKAQDS